MEIYISLIIKWCPRAPNLRKLSQYSRAATRTQLRPARFNNSDSFFFPALHFFLNKIIHQI